jgi:peptide/nickel transport system permease protein
VTAVTKLLAQRTALGLLLLSAVSALIFAGTELLPGDVAQAILGQNSTPQALANLRRELGLNRPPVERYLSWISGVLHGDLGDSLANREPVSQLIAKRLGNTALLAGMAALIAVPMAIFLGLISVLHRNRILDRCISIVSLGAISMPEFFIGYLLILLFAVQWHLLPSMAALHDGMSLGQKLEVLALPCATLVLVTVGHMMRMTRAAILNIMSLAYIEMAELKGLPPMRIIWHHAFPNAVAPIINVVVLNLAYLIVGVVVVEVVFVYPGLGSLMVDHVAARDVPVVQACGLIFATTYIVLNTLADLVATIANPRLRHPR